MNIENYKKYYYNDFTFESYKQLIQIAKNNFEFKNYSEFNKKESFLLWRHDLDVSIESALKIAIIENELNIKSTYFLLLHSEHYNLLEKHTTDLIKKIILLGHNIGLHFDPSYYGITNENDLDVKIDFEKDIIEKIFNVSVKVFSFHNTNSFIMSCQKDTYGGLINTYSAFFQNEIKYCSDSNGYWRFDRLIDVLNNKSNQKMQILTHPEWWTENPDAPRNKIINHIEYRAKSTLDFYDSFLIKDKRENIR